MRDGLAYPPGWIPEACEHSWAVLGILREDPGKQYLGCSVGVQGQAGDLGHIKVHMPHRLCRWD